MAHNTRKGMERSEPQTPNVATPSLRRGGLARCLGPARPLTEALSKRAGYGPQFHIGPIGVQV
jgi:hypothetical protein